MRHCFMRDLICMAKVMKMYLHLVESYLDVKSRKGSLEKIKA